MTATPAMLWIVATPIGNLEDVAARAARVLSEVAVIAAEDTRHSARLSEHLAIGTPMLSLHEHNEAERVPQLIGRLQAGEAVALISDAGTPLISDPGFALVRAARAEGIEVRCVPGACAAVAALSVAGLPSDRFVFEGFLPHKKGRQKRLALLADEQRTVVFYESPHRILKLLQELKEHCGGDRWLACSREISKLHEQTVRGTVDGLIEHFTEHDPKGEFVVVVAGKG